MQAMQTLPNPRRAVAGQNCLIVEDSAFDSEKLTRVIHNIKTNLVVEVASTLRLLFWSVTGQHRLCGKRRQQRGLPMC